jgi:hypothetical protein
LVAAEAVFKKKLLRELYKKKLLRELQRSSQLGAWQRAGRTTVRACTPVTRSPDGPTGEDAAPATGSGRTTG